MCATILWTLYDNGKDFDKEQKQKCKLNHFASNIKKIYAS